VGAGPVSRLPTLTSLKLWGCASVTDKQVQELSSPHRSLHARSSILFHCLNVTAAAKQALRTAIPNLTIHG
jgi:outer membrane murein-binding lipoprotein Lpp